MFVALNGTIYNEALAYYPMDTSSGMLNLKTDQEFVDVGLGLATIGPMNGAGLFDRFEVSIDPFDVPRCLWMPPDCTNGFSLAFWINILEVFGNETLVLGKKHFETLSGVNLKAFTRGAQKIFQISVISSYAPWQSLRSRCEIQFKYIPSTWMHVTFTWYKGTKINLFLNGVMHFPEMQLCSTEYGTHDGHSTPITPDLGVPFIIGSPEVVVLLDDIAVWDRRLIDGEVYDIYHTVIGGKPTIPVRELKIT